MFRKSAVGDRGAREVEFGSMPFLACRRPGHSLCLRMTPVPLDQSLTLLTSFNLNDLLTRGQLETQHVNAGTQDVAHGNGGDTVLTQ